MSPFKRELVPGTYLTAADMLSLLSRRHFKAAALQGRIVLAVQPPVAWLLDSCCVGRAAMQTGAALMVVATAVSSGDSASGEAQLAAWVLAVTGVNAAEPELWAQYRQHQQQVWAAQQRKASRSRRAAAAAAALAPPGSDQQAGGSEQVCLVQLTFQEAVFLSHVLGCCQVYVVDDRSNSSGVGTGQQQQQQQQGARGGAEGLVPLQQQGVVQDHHQQQQPAATPTAVLSGDELWRWCCQHSTGGAGVFAPQYAAYHHLRSSGWLPLPGLAYGADYVLYQLHPENAHSDFVVTVMVEGDARDAAGHLAAGAEQQPAAQQVHGGSGVGAGGQVVPSTQLAWLDACIMHRLARQVLKEMMLLYVVVPPGLSLDGFDCIHSLQVREVLVQRWVPSEHREVK